MIHNWDIISRRNPSTGDQLFTLVTDGTKNDALLVAKKLEGYAQPPVKTVAPYSYALALSSNLDDETVEKIRTAMREVVEQSQKINQFVPNGTLGNPLFNTPQADKTSFFTGLAPDINEETTFFHLDEADVTATPTEQGQNISLEAHVVRTLDDPNQPAAEITDSHAVKISTGSLTISDKDMLIKDMEDTLLGKMPPENFFNEDTKYDVFSDVENKELTKVAQAKRAEKIEAATSDKKASLEESFNVFEQNMQEENCEAELEDLHTVTDRLTEKDLGFVKHANTDPHLVLPQNMQEQAPQDEEGIHRPQQDITEIPEEIPLEEEIAAVQSEEQKEHSFLSKRTPANLPEITIRAQSSDILEKTFNLDSTLSIETMRSQYEKTLGLQQPQEKKTQPDPQPETLETETDSKPIAHPVQTLLRRKEKAPTQTKNTASSQAKPQPKVEKESNPEGQTMFRIRRKEKKVLPPTPPAPKAPAAPGAPQPPTTHTILRPRVAAQTPAPAPVPAAPTPDATQPVSAPAPAAPAPAPAPEPAAQQKQEKIDHSIELPVSELKKHNWPLEVPLLPTYTLENLVLSVNRFAHATAISVIENPGKMYNPLVFHGATGTGKTHFLNAMAYGFSKRYGQENVFMTNGVRFSRGIQRYVMEGNIDKFERFMNTVKVLLIDDIHLLAVNEQNRAYISRLLHSFLKEQKQIVITSKYPPDSLQKLEDLIKFRLDSGWISELKPTTGNVHFKIVKRMLLNNGVDLSDSQITQFFNGPHMTLSTVVRNIRRLKVLENLVFPHLQDAERSQAGMFEKLLATNGEDPNSELLAKDPASVTSLSPSSNTDWGRIGFFYPNNSAGAMSWMVYALEQRAKELGIKGGFEIAVRSSYSTENIISSAFKIANLCDNKKLRGAVILGPALNVCEPSVRENFYDILTHMLEIMLIRCGIINTEALRLPSTYVKVISELLR